MFCFQCEQTASCKACAGNVGVCGKKADTAELQDKLTGALIGLARATEGNQHVVSDSTAAVIVEGLPQKPLRQKNRLHHSDSAFSLSGAIPKLPT